MNLPDFVCIGAQKAGTTWLHKMISQHPDIWMGPFKEYQFFNSVFVPQHTRWTKWHVKMSIESALKYHVEHEKRPNLHYVKFLTEIATDESIFTEGWYRHIFGFRKGMVKGDITPEYCTLPDEGVDYFLRLLGAVPVVFIIRDPVSRALSQLKMNLSRGNVAVQGDKDAWHSAVNDWDIHNRGDYKTYVPRWLSRYPNAKLLFLPYGQIASQPERFLAKVETHIGVAAHSYPEASQKIHEGKKVGLPDFVKPMVEEAMKDQVEFIREHFGAEFLAETR